MVIKSKTKIQCSWCIAEYNAAGRSFADTDALPYYTSLQFIKHVHTTHKVDESRCKQFFIKRQQFIDKLNKSSKVSI